MKKTLWLDTETTGTDPSRHAIIQFAALVEIDGKIVDEMNMYIRPQKGAIIEDAALAVSGIKRDELYSDAFLPHNDAYRVISLFLKLHVDTFDRNDKFYPAGFNVRFDIDFLQAMFKEFDRYGLGSYINWRAIDPLPLLHMMDYSGRISLPDYKLSTVCAHFGIEINAHNALSDIRATRELTQKLMSEAFGH